MKKFFLSIFVLILAALAIGFLARNIIAKKSVEAGCVKLTGFPLQVGSVDVGVFSGTLEIKDLKLENSPEFHGGTFVLMPHFKVDYVTMSMLGGSPHLRELVINVEEAVLVKNEKGETNADAIQAKVTPQDKPVTDKKELKYRVDLVKVHIGTVIKRTYNKAGQPSDMKIVLNKDIEIKDLTESTSITAVVMKAILGPLGDVAGELMKGVGGAVKGVEQLGKGATQAGKGLFDKVKQAVPKK